MSYDIGGQWVGQLTGTNNGPIIINIDKNKMDQLEIMFEDQTGDRLSLVANGFITKYPSNDSYKGRLGFFRHFDPKTRREVSVNDPSRFATGSDIAFKLVDKEIIKGEWTTNVKTQGQITLKRQYLIPGSPIKKIISWSEFKVEIYKLLSSRGLVYYRGHESSEFPLNNLFHRMDCWNLSSYFDYLNDKLFENLSRLNNDRYRLHDPVDFGAGLLLAQHHGYPTPLMDWTLSPYIAAYFAFRNFKRQTNFPSVRVFCFYQRQWMIDNNDMVSSALISPWPVIRPLNFSLGNNQRAITQDAVSLFSNVWNIEAEICNRGKQYLEYFDINFEDQKEALLDLETMGIFEERLFPDLDTVCKVHKKEYFGVE